MDSKPTVLVVDDEATIRFSIRKALERAGADVSTAETGEQALEMLAEKPFDTVLTDIRMPGISGVDLLRLIKETNPDARVVLMTGYANLDTSNEAELLGAHAYLIKPVSSQVLLERVLGEVSG